MLVPSHAVPGAGAAAGFSAVYPKIVLFGDSITEYSHQQLDGFSFAAALADDYCMSVDVVKRGYSGYSTAQARHMIGPILDQEARSSEVALVTIFFGANDAATAGPQHVELEQYRANLVEMVEAARLRGVRVVLITPGPVDSDTFQLIPLDIANGWGTRTYDTTKTYRDACVLVGEELGVPVVDVYHEFELWAAANNTTTSGLLCDGLHFGGQGYRVLHQAVKATIATAYPEWAPAAHPCNHPYWREIPPGYFPE